MFGGLAFLHGNMTPAPMEMGGRTMDGWLMVAPEDVKSDGELASWVERSVAFVKTLPPK
jgi:hypothetical protein